jgi:pyridoxamine 5'-phosphate oxidase
VEESVSDLYFESRPRGSQISAWASDQSRPIESRQALEAKVAEMEERFSGVDALPRPDKWGGFVIEPERVEFWAGRTSRLHDRIRFQRSGDSWEIDRLQP